MKKKVLLVFLLLIVIVLSGCHANNKNPPYSLKLGAYGFEKAIITNKLTQETIERSLDDIIADTVEYRRWGNLFSFTVSINKNTEYVYANDKRCFVLKESLAFEVIEKDTLKLHFPHWIDENFQQYDIVIILFWQQTYA